MLEVVVSFTNGGYGHMFSHFQFGGQNDGAGAKKREAELIFQGQYMYPELYALVLIFQTRS